MWSKASPKQNWHRLCGAADVSFSQRRVMKGHQMRSFFTGLSILALSAGLAMAAPTQSAGLGVGVGIDGGASGTFATFGSNSAAGGASFGNGGASATQQSFATFTGSNAVAGTGAGFATATSTNAQTGSEFTESSYGNGFGAAAGTGTITGATGEFAAGLGVDVALDGYSNFGGFGSF